MKKLIRSSMLTSRSVLVFILFLTTIVRTTTLAEEFRSLIGYHNWFRGESEVENRDRVFEMTKDVGDWTLFGVHWAWMQLAPDGVINFSSSDTLLESALRNNLNVIMQVFTTPEFARLPLFQSSINNPYSSEYSALSNDSTSRVNWDRFCRAVVNRYYPRVTHFEIGNEPNDNHFYRYFRYDSDSICFYDSNSYVPYPEYLRIAYLAMHEQAQLMMNNNPSYTTPLTVLGGALMQIGGINNVITHSVLNYQSPGDLTQARDLIRIKRPDQLLQEMYQLSDTTFFDALSYHPYGNIGDTSYWDDPLLVEYEGSNINPASCFMFTSELYDIMCANEDTLKKIFGTECGPQLIIDHTGSNGDVDTLFSEEHQALWAEKQLDRWMEWEFTGPLLWWSMRRQYQYPFNLAGQDTTGMRRIYGCVRENWTRAPAYYYWKAMGNGELSGNVEIYSGRELEFLAPYLNNSIVVLKNCIELNKPAHFGSGHRVVIKSATNSSPKTITGCLALNDCSLTLENVNLEQPANYASRDSSFIGYGNISLGEQAKLYIKGLNSRVHVDGQIVGTPDSLLIENADLSNSHDMAFMRMGGGEIALKNCAMNEAENFGDLSTFRFADSNVHFTDFTCVDGFSDSSTVELLNSNAVFEDSRILSNSSLFGVGGVYFKSMDDHVLTLRGLELRDNETLDQTRPSNAYVQGGDLDTSDPRGASFICESLSCTSNAPQVMIDVTSRPDRTIYSIQNSTFRGGSAYISSFDNELLPEVCAIRNVIIDNCHVIANQAGGTFEHVTITSTGQLETDSVVPFTARRSILMCDTNGMVLPSDGHNWTSSHGDPRLAASGEPKWNSPCLDLLDDELDFDLTNGDLGGKAFRVVANLHGSYDGRLPLGNYHVTNHTVIDSSITPGSAFIVTAGKQLWIRGYPDGNFTRKLGDLNSPRTSIVGRDSLTAIPASIIKIVNGQEEETAQLHLEGVLFNFSPGGANAISELLIQGWQPLYCEGPQIDGTNVEFKNYTNDPSQSGTYDGGLSLEQCSGAVRALDFGKASGPAWLKLRNCRTDVDHNTFEPRGEVPCLKVDGILTGETPNVTDNSFVVVNDQVAPLLDASGGLLNLRRNQFLNCRTTPISLHSSSLHAEQEARNDFRADPDVFEDSKPLVDMQGGYLNLFCGRNNFVVYAYNEDWPVISWIPDTSHTQALMTWRENFWGTSCQLGIPDSTLNDRSIALIPPWATVEDNLSECVEETTPANPVCPFEMCTPLQLLANGKTAEILGTFSFAQDNYRALLWLWAAKKEANEGTLRLKALGLHKEYGPEAYELVRDDLFTASDSSHVVKLIYQEVLQRCSGWCVEARWGDRPLAIQSLNTMLALAIDQVKRDIIKRALLEIATYPPQGGLQTLDAEALFAQEQALQAATAALMNFKSGQDVVLNPAVQLPRSFDIARLYPNPFNATVTLELSFPTGGQARVRVFNLQGQVVQTVLDQRVTAGVRKSTLDASGWSSGLYFVVAEHKGTVQVRKMTLLK